MVLIIKKLTAFVLAASLLTAFCPSAEAKDVPAVSAECAIVMHDGGEIVYEKNADKRALIASTTKLMTAIVAIENCVLDDEVEIGAESVGVEGSSMYLKAGQKITVEKLLLGLLLVSGNDAATALALHTAGSIEAFAGMMNEKAAELGMDGSHFVNPHGLNAEGHYSTARDMARLMLYCMENATFSGMISRRSFAVDDMVYLNHNKLLYALPGCLGGKTGYTMAAGRCLVSCAERGGTRFVCVTLSAPDDWNDHKALYEWAFSEYSDRDVTDIASFYVTVAGGSEESVRAVPEERLTVFVRRDAELTVTALLPRFVIAPVIRGERAGTAQVYCGSELCAQSRLIYESDVGAEE